MKSKFVFVMVVVGVLLLQVTTYASEEEFHVRPPDTLEECYAILDEILSEEDKEFIKNYDFHDLVDLHFSLGLWIRNNWLYVKMESYPDYLEEYIERYGYFAPDIVSGYLIQCYYMYLNGEEYNLDIRAQMYGDWAEKETRLQELSRYLGPGIYIGLAILCVVIARKKAKLSKTYRLGPKILRVPIVMGASGLIVYLVTEVLTIYAEQSTKPISPSCINLVLNALAALLFTATSIFCFRDMTKKDIIKSAILPCIYGIVIWMFDFKLRYAVFIPVMFSFDIWFLTGYAEYVGALCMLFPLLYAITASTKVCAECDKVEMTT